MARSILYCKSDAGGKDDKADAVASSMAAVSEVGLVEYPVANTCGRLSFMVVVDDDDVPCSLVDCIILDRVAGAAGEHVVVLLRLYKNEMLLLLLWLMDLERSSDAGWNAVVPPPPNARATRRNVRMQLMFIF